MDFPEPFAPIRTDAFGISEIEKSARDLKPRMLTDSILVGFIEYGLKVTHLNRHQLYFAQTATRRGVSERIAPNCG